MMTSEQEQKCVNELKNLIYGIIVEMPHPQHIAVYACLELAAEMTGDWSYFEEASTEVGIDFFCTNAEKEFMLQYM